MPRTSLFLSRAARRKEKKVNKKEMPVLVPSARQKAWFVESSKFVKVIRYRTVL